MNKITKQKVGNKTVGEERLTFLAGKTVAIAK